VASGGQSGPAGGSPSASGGSGGSSGSSSKVGGGSGGGCNMGAETSASAPVWLLLVIGAALLVRNRRRP
jgi:MYXO-CTERM domain-containing protein